MSTNIFDRSQLDSRSNPNLLTNGNFSVWQRGTVSSHTGFTFALTADRWFTYVGGGTVTVSEGYGYGSSVQKQGLFIDSDNGATDVQIGQRIESSMFSSNDFGYGEQFTFSIWVYAESDDNDLGFAVSVPDTVDSYTSSTTKVAEYFGTTKANEWTKLTITFPWHKDFNKGMQIAITVAGTFQQGMTFSRAKLETGPVATPFIPDHPAVNLAKCQRYYHSTIFKGWKLYPFSAYTGNYGILGGEFPTEMRVSPSMSLEITTSESLPTSGWSQIDDRIVATPCGFSARLLSSLSAHQNGYVALQYYADAELY